MDILNTFRNRVPQSKAAPFINVCGVLFPRNRQGRRDAGKYARRLAKKPATVGRGM